MGSRAHSYVNTRFFFSSQTGNFFKTSKIRRMTLCVSSGTTPIRISNTFSRHFPAAHRITALSSWGGGFFFPEEGAAPAPEGALALFHSKKTLHFSRGPISTTGFTRNCSKFSSNHHRHPYMRKTHSAVGLERKNSSSRCCFCCCWFTTFFHTHTHTRAPHRLPRIDRPNERRRNESCEPTTNQRLGCQFNSLAVFRR